MLLSIHTIVPAVQMFNQFRVDALLVFNERAGELETIQHSSVPILNYGVSNQTDYPTIDVGRKLAIEAAVTHLVEKKASPYCLYW